jgi:D-alanine-D-alanine ligase
VLALMHEDLVPPESPGDVDVATAEWRTEYDVVTTIRKLGHEVLPLGVRSDLGVIRQAIEEWKPHVAFNLLEEFDGVSVYDQNVVSFLELLRTPYTGATPRGLMLARDKALSKKILAYHRIPVPEFAVMPVGRSARKPKHMKFPVIVKSLTSESSAGISQASIVDTDEKFQERVRFIHQRLATDAIAEAYIEGRELCVGVMGNQRLQVFPAWELLFTKMPDEMFHIATERVKWNTKYQKKHGIRSSAAVDLPPEVTARLEPLCKRIYRSLGLTGYARIDFRMDEKGGLYVLEANPNPQIARGEDFADSAAAAGIKYEALLQKILSLGMRGAPEASQA